jgi:hypothetical protein
MLPFVTVPAGHVPRQSIARLSLVRLVDQPSAMIQQNTEYAVGWFTLSLINSGLAQSKGRSGVGWWLLSVFIGPLATLLIVIIDRNPDEAQTGKGGKKFNLEDHREQ